MLIHQPKLMINIGIACGVAAFISRRHPNFVEVDKGISNLLIARSLIEDVLIS